MPREEIFFFSRLCVFLLFSFSFPSLLLKLHKIVTCTITIKDKFNLIHEIILFTISSQSSLKTQCCARYCSMLSSRMLNNLFIYQPLVNQTVTPIFSQITYTSSRGFRMNPFRIALFSKRYASLSKGIVGTLAKILLLICQRIPLAK